MIAAETVLNTLNQPRFILYITRQYLMRFEFTASIHILYQQCHFLLHVYFNQKYKWEAGPP